MRVFDLRSFGVGDELSIEGVGDPSLQAAQGLKLGLAVGSLASVVGPAWGVEADLADRGDVDHVVHPPVPGPGEAVAVLLAGGRVASGAVPVQDANRLRSANRAMSPTSAKVRAATTGPTP
jgi:hypothetical protein